ncbi:alpha/beta fold hydrolase [Gordonia soli]|uniref:Putative hydrolase n=1 Tax=Gordonia soli NBRC 108243 TaxID=1223545 RepID=M0QHC6_9ACTN|nr:alpha/beta hydrolase [Gordonia soli]GAC68040.1 putative hydrolase [Gordonia soli NBRC 108243]
MHGVRVGDVVDGGTYVDVAGRPIWHFVDGEPSGPPTVLLHGAFASAATWGAQIPDFLGGGLRLYVPERSGHGHSPDGPEPFTYESMADELIAYLDGVVGGPAHLVGWSDGSVVALLVAYRRPDLVNRMVVFGQFYNQAGREADEFSELLRRRDPHTVDVLRADYATNSPDGADHFDVVLDKELALIARAPDYDLRGLSGITAPTLVVQGDHDVVRLEHSVELVRNLPAGRLAVLPGTHILPVEAPELFNPLVLSFLALDPPRRWLP